MNKLLSIALLLLLLLSACTPLKPVPLPEADSYKNADLGPKPINVEKIIRPILEETLFDPDSMKLECLEIKKHWFTNDIDYMLYVNNVIESMEVEYFPVWRITCKLNAKNRFGGYVGYQKYQFYLDKNQKVLKYINLSNFSNNHSRFFTALTD